MRQSPVAARVANLEQTVSELAELPARVASVELQIVQLRGEMRGEFSAVTTELRDECAAVRAEMRALGETLRTEMRALNDETRTHMRVLHEEVLSRIALIGERPNGQKRRKR